MKQILQSFKTGATILEDVPEPNVSGNKVLIHTSKSLVSLGTERMLVSFGKASYLEKARQQPDKVKMVLDKVKTDGLMPTIAAVQNKLDQPIPLGYSNVGIVTRVGKSVTAFKEGDRVVSNGPHAEVVAVAKNLVAKIPNEVTDEEAAFTVIGAIALQGLRLAGPTLGETFVVQGLGLIGLITCQLLKTNGCTVIGIDPDQSKCKLADGFGITSIHLGSDNPVEQVLSLTNQIGADGVIITASASTDEIVSQAAQMSRKRGRIILVGVVGLKLNRAEFYEKELSFQVSCSYGPGRYDEQYEGQGIDYPIGFVRWTEKRNFEAVLEAMRLGTLDVKPLISERVPLEKVVEVYKNISTSDSVATIIEYPERVGKERKTTIQITDGEFKAGKGVLGLIGAGNFAKMTMLPVLAKAGANLKYIASSGGVSGTHLAKKFRIQHSTTNYQTILADEEVDMVIITTQHHMHAPMVCDALNAGKHVFVEKPLAINEEQLENVHQTLLKNTGLSLTVGFNRRFSMHIQKIKSLLGDTPGPMNIIATMNAGAIPQDSWIQDMERGGGRIIGEACHFIDLMVFITGSKVKAVCMNAMGPNAKLGTDNASILVRFENGSNGVVNYFANGSKGYSKERVEVFSQRRTLVLDNFRTLQGYGFKGFKKLKTKQDKGHKKQFELLVDRVANGGNPLITIDEIYNVSRASIMAVESLKSGGLVEI